MADPIFAVPLSFHNFMVLLIVVPILLWIAKVAYQILMIMVVYRQLFLTRTVFLDRMSVYAQDFQQLIRQHFNQILRMRRTVPPKEVPQHQLRVHLHPESLEVTTSKDKVSLGFVFDASVECNISFYWGPTVEACNKLVKDSAPCSNRSPRESHGGSLEMGYQPPSLEGNGSSRPLFPDNDFLQRSQIYCMPAGLRQTFSINLHDKVSLKATGSTAPAPAESGDATGGSSSSATPRVDLAIVISPSLSEKQVTFVRCENRAKAEVLQQVVFTNHVGHRILGVYGFEDEEPGEADCMVCYERFRSVIILPCRHCSVCSTCLRSLRDERCPMCRSSFSAYLLLPLLRAEAPV